MFIGFIKFLNSMLFYTLITKPLESPLSFVYAYIVRREYEPDMNELLTNYE